MQKLFSFFLLTFFLSNAIAQQTTQTVRGTLRDEVSQTPLPGATIRVLREGQTQLGAMTDANGDFKIIDVPLGRQTLRITSVGYEDLTLPDVTVTAGKEVILALTLTEAVTKLNEVVVVADRKDDASKTNNELSLVSARSFNIDDTKRFAGALGDPSRMAANFAGVVSANDSRNDIVVRGNSPSGMLWQLEGLNIPNPNHFGSLNSTGGPVSMLNNNVLGKSDFVTSAFPAQYGNALSAVFDLRMREGNTRKHEFLGQIGFNGFEAGAEGPLSKNSKASYLVNYRYSTLSVFSALGINFGTGSAVPNYQDLNYKIVIP
ncbi:MAG: carboxypeptidase-like regulatory domain-containing protein, partial [Sphingobacteriaceae bacterium]|nr:carboxypeptidase-like regulatory domain-containing protein [Cytophagaceae bacterium]